MSDRLPTGTSRALRAVALLLAVVLIAGSCGSNMSVEDDGAGTPVLDSTTLGNSIVLQRVTISDTDPFGVGGNALTLLVPAGWTVTGGPVWRHDRANLVTGEVVVSSPDGFSQVEFLPIFSQVWQDGGLFGFGAGDNYLGATVRAPIGSIVEFLASVVLPAARSGLAYEIIAAEPLPDVANAVVAGLPNTESIAARVRVRYPFGEGPDLLEEFTVALSFTTSPALPGLTNWAPHTLFAIRALEQDFEAARPVLQTIAQSPVIDIDWFARYQYVLNLSRQNGLDAIEGAGRTSQIIAELSDETFEIYRETYRNAQAVNDQIANQFVQVTRGVETYDTPFDDAGIQLPLTFDRVYATDDGTVILSNDPAFDPATEFPGLTWEILEPRRR